MSKSGRPQDNGPPPGLTLLGAGVYTELNGNIHSVHPTEFDSSALPVSGRRNGSNTPLVAQLGPVRSPRHRKRLKLTVDWVRTRRSLLRQRVSTDSEEGGVEPADDPEETQSQQLASAVHIHPAPLNNSSNGHGTRIGEALGCYASETVHDGAHSVQRFFGIDQNDAAYLIAKPANEVMPAGAAGPGETVVGRVIGCIQTGAVLSGGTSHQIYGSPRSASSSAHQGFSVIAPKRPSKSNFSAMGAGQTLGQAPSSSD